jgi:hypothetical protein
VTGADRSTLRTRAGVAILFAVLTAAYATARAIHEPGWPTDFDQLWHAARAMLAGNDPYTAVGPGKSFQWDWPLYYPLPAVMLAVPFSVLPVIGARIAFSALSAALLGWALGARARTHWPLLLSAAYIISTSRAQWAPLLLASAWIPALGFAIAAKPNVGLAALAAQDRRRDLMAALVGCFVIMLLSFIAQPGWFTSWRTAIATAPHIQSAVTVLPFGPLLLLAALRWRRADARLLLALAVIPHTPSVYDVLVLFFACRSFRETTVLALLTQALYWGIVFFGSFNTFDAYAEGLGRAAILVVYLPVLAAILFRANQPDDPVQPVTDSNETARLVPANWVDASLLSLLLVAATFLVWLPLVTYR